MAERIPPELKLVWDAPEDAICAICQKHRGGLMMQFDSPEAGRKYVCALCGHDLAILAQELNEREGE